MLNIINSKMQTKTTMRYHYTSTNMAKIKNKVENNRQGRGAPGTHMFLLGMKSGIATLENSLAVSYKVKHF